MKENQAATNLRERPEQQLGPQTQAVPLTEAEVRRTLHELQVRQIVMQRQNESLQRSEAQAQDALRRLAEFYSSIEEKVGERAAELAEALQAAQAASRAKSAFLSNMSHELHTPLNGVLGMIDLALRRATDPKQADCLGKVRDSARQLISVINDILEISKIEAEQLHVESAVFRLGPVLELLNALMMPEAARRGLDFAVEIDPALASRPLRGDQQRLGQVLVKLAGNAVKFTDNGGVCVRVRID